MKRTARIAKLVSGGRHHFLISLIVDLAIMALLLYSFVTTSDSTAQWLSGAAAAMLALTIRRGVRTRRARRF